MIVLDDEIVHSLWVWAKELEELEELEEFKDVNIKKFIKIIMYCFFFNLLIARVL